MASQLRPHAPARRTVANTPALLRHGFKRLAMLELLRRRGRHWGLLAQYEENRLGL